MPPVAQQTILEAIKQVGFPIVVAGTLLWIGNKQIETDRARFDKQQEFIVQTLSVQLEKSTTVMAAIDVTLKGMANEQRETRNLVRGMRYSGEGHDGDSAAGP